MASSDDLRRSVQDGASVSALIDNYRAQQEAWRAKAQDLARMRDALRAAADREARSIVASAQRDIEEVLRKANEDLAALNAQVRALSDAAEGGLPAESAAGLRFGRRAGDLQQVAAIVSGAEQDLLDVGDQTRARLDVLSADAASGVAESTVGSTGARGDAKPGPFADVPGPPSPSVVARESVTGQDKTDREGRLVPAAPPDLPPTTEPPASAASPVETATQATSSWPPTSHLDVIAPQASLRALEGAARTGLPRSLRTFIAAFAVLGAAILAATGWWYWQSRGGLVPSSPVATAATPSPVAPPVEGGASPASTAGANPGIATPGDNASLPPGAPETASAAAPSTGRLAVKVEATRLAWLRVVVDDRVVAVREFQPGETQMFNGAREVQIRAGDAGAVRVSVDGGEPVPLGRDGQSVTRRFAPSDAGSSVAGTSSASPVVPTSGGTIGALSPVPRGDGSSAASLADADRPVVPAAAMMQPPAPAPNTAAPVATSPTPRGVGDGLAGIPAAGPTGNAGASESVTHATLEGQFVRAVGRWFESYQRQDRAGMAAFSSGPPSVSDERTDSERAPRGVGGVRRTFEDVRLQLVTENAVFTTKMTERFDDPATGRSRQWDSFVSQLWTLRAGVWQLEDVRVVPTSKLKQTFR